MGFERGFAHLQLDRAFVGRAVLRAFLIAGLVIVAGSVAGCAPDAPDEDAARVSAILAEILSEADEVGIDAKARETLVAAIDAGRPISLEEVKQAQYETIECVKGVGFDVQVFDHPGAPGGIAYFFGIPGSMADLPEDMSAEAHACEERSVWWLDAAYQRTNLAPVDSLATEFEPYRTAFIACLEGRGAIVDAELSAEELLSLGADPLYVEGFELPCVATVGFDATP